MFNIFKKKSSQTDDQKGKNSEDQLSGGQSMGMMQKLAMKKLMAMSETERAKLMQKFLTPDNISKNKDKILAAMEQMKKTGQISEAQFQEGKKRLGL